MSASAWRWRPLAPGELDHERLWLSVASVTGAAAVFAVRRGVQTPPCLFHWATGYPCPGCGSTRAFRQLVQGHLGAAFIFNPMATAACVAIILYCLYAAIVLGARLPRFHLAELSRRAAHSLRITGFLALAANWWWVIAHGR